MRRGFCTLFSFLNLILISSACFKSVVNSGSQTDVPVNVCTNETLCAECGSADYEANVRIVGGYEATPYSWPSQVFVRQTYGILINGKVTYRSFQCGGTLIQKNVVLTAAHCLSTVFSFNSDVTYTPNEYFPTLESTYSIYMGLHDISSIPSIFSTPAAPGVKKTVRKIIRHESYNTRSMANDVMLLVLSSDVTLSSYIRTACVPTTSNSYPGTNRVAFAAGWGYLEEGGPSPTKLQNIALTVYEASKCSNYGTIGNSQICAGEYNGGKDTCQGDSGGGLYVKETNSGKTKIIVSGITSFGTGCARAGYPGVYTRVSFFADWINTKLALI